MSNSQKDIAAALEELRKDDRKLTISAVAKKAGVHPSLIHNRHPDIKLAIDDEIARRKSLDAETSRQSEMLKLKQRNASLKNQLEKLKEKNESEAVKSLLIHVTELYSMNDQLLKENKVLLEKLKAK